MHNFKFRIDKGDLTKNISVAIEVHIQGTFREHSGN
jgi:hypothetical protein